MPRKVNQQFLPTAIEYVQSFHPTIVEEVEQVISSNDVVIIEMVHNPYVRKAKNALRKANISFVYLECGSYFSQWKQRLAIKMWSGWPIFPQVFITGQLLGGATRTIQALTNVWSTTIIGYSKR